MLKWTPPPDHLQRLLNMTKEVVSLHIGQAGVHMSSAFWELLCLEHELQVNGYAYDTIQDSNCLENIFSESPNGNYVPRAILFDMEPSVIDELRVGSYRQLWNPGYVISGKEDASSLFAKGYYSNGKKYIPILMDRILKLVRKCDNFSGFVLMNSYAGGTGSGIGSLLMEKCTEDFGKKCKFTFSVFPSPRMSQAMVDPYNSIMHATTTLESTDCSIFCDNETLYQKCVTRLGCPSPSISLINRLYSLTASNVFLSHRFTYHGSPSMNVSELLVNLVPYPRIHFPVLSMAPIIPYNQLEHETMDVAQITDSVFLNESQICACDIYRHKYISCALLYRGEVNSLDVYKTLTDVKHHKHVTFVDWCPTGFKLAVNTKVPIIIPNVGFALPRRCVTMISGNLGVVECFKRLTRHYDCIYSKRAFVHHYVSEGMEEGEFQEARDKIEGLVRDYDELAKETNSGDVSPVPPPKQTSIQKKSVSIEDKSENIKSSKSQKKKSVSGEKNRASKEDYSFGSKEENIFDSKEDDNFDAKEDDNLDFKEDNKPNSNASAKKKGSQSNRRSSGRSTSRKSAHFSPAALHTNDSASPVRHEQERDRELMPDIPSPETDIKSPLNLASPVSAKKLRKSNKNSCIKPKKTSHKVKVNSSASHQLSPIASEDEGMDVNRKNSKTEHSVINEEKEQHSGNNSTAPLSTISVTRNSWEEILKQTRENKNQSCLTQSQDSAMDSRLQLPVVSFLPSEATSTSYSISSSSAVDYSTVQLQDPNAFVLLKQLLETAQQLWGRPQTISSGSSMSSSSKSTAESNCPEYDEESTLTVSSPSLPSSKMRHLVSEEISVSPTSEDTTSALLEGSLSSERLHNLSNTQMNDDSSLDTDCSSGLSLSSTAILSPTRSQPTIRRLTYTRHSPAGKQDKRRFKKDS